MRCLHWGGGIGGEGGPPPNHVATTYLIKAWIDLWTKLPGIGCGTLGWRQAGLEAKKTVHRQKTSDTGVKSPMGKK